MNKQALESYYLATHHGLSSAKGRGAWRDASGSTLTFVEEPEVAT